MKKAVFTKNINWKKLFLLFWILSFPFSLISQPQVSPRVEPETKKRESEKVKNYSIFGGVGITYTSWDIGPLNSYNSMMEKLSVYNLIGDFQKAGGTSTKIMQGVGTRNANMALIGVNAIIKSGEAWSVSYSGTIGDSGFHTYAYIVGNITGKFDSTPQQYTNSQSFFSYLPLNTRIRRNDHSLIFNRKIYRINCNNSIFAFVSYKYQDYSYNSKPDITVGYDDHRILETGEQGNNQRFSTGKFAFNSRLNGPGLGLGYTYVINTINSLNLSLGMIAMQGNISEFIDLWTYNKLSFSNFSSSLLYNTFFKLNERVIATGYTIDTNYNLVLNNILLRIHLFQQVTTYSTSNTEHNVYTVGINSYSNTVSAYGTPISTLEGLANFQKTGFNHSKDTFNGISFSILKSFN